MLRRLLCVSFALTLAACAGSKVEVAKPTALTDFNATAYFSERWHAQLGDPGNYQLHPALGKTQVVGASSKGLLTALDRASGKRVWQINTGVVISGGVGGNDGLWVIGTDKGEVRAYDADGKALWSSKVSSEVLSVPQVADGVVVVRSGDGRIVGLSAAEGKRLWTYERITPTLVVRSFASVTIQRGSVYAGFAAGKIVALDLKMAACCGRILCPNRVAIPNWIVSVTSPATWW